MYSLISQVSGRQVDEEVIRLPDYFFITVFEMFIPLLFLAMKLQ